MDVSTSLPAPDGFTTVYQNTTDDGVITSDLMFFVSRVVNYTFLLPGLCVFAVVTNAINIVVFVKIGFKDSINISLLGLAISDMVGNTILSWFAIALIPWLEDLDPPYDPYKIVYLTSGWPHFAFIRLTGVITGFITFERCLCVMIPLKVKSIITRRRVVIFLVLAYVITISCFIPVYLTHRHDWVFYPEFNKSLISLVVSEQRLLFETIYFPFIGMFFPFSTFIFVVICTILLVTSLKRKAEWRKSATGASKASEISSKENKISALVVMISTLFIACFFPVTCAMVGMVSDSEFSIVGKRYRAFLVVWSFFFLLEALNACLNIFIYYYKSTNYRNMFDQIFRKKAIASNN